MEPVEFAQYYLQPYKTKGNELIPLYCPFCKGGQRHDKYTFALNVEKKVYKCLRGSCGVEGHFTELLKHFGIERKKVEWVPPKSKMQAVRSRSENYLRSRGFSPATWQKCGVSEVNGNIAFPYYENGQVVLLKFRKPEKYAGRGQKAWRESGGKDVLWCMQLCSPDKPLIITEGEFDTLALYEAGLENVVSVPSGNENLKWVETCWDWLKQFSKIIIWGDNDEPGKKMVRNLLLKLDEWEVATVDSPHKDANECLYREGAAGCQKYINQAQAAPIEGLLDLSDVEPLDVSKIERVKTNITWLDKELGGFNMGELTVWTGKPGSGKSTFVSQMLLESIDQNYKVCAYSGELRADRFQYWLYLQAAGKNNIKQYFDPVRQTDISYIPKQTIQKIKLWHKGKFFLYDNEISSQNAENTGILKMFALAAKRYGCKVFLVDNLMTSRFDGKSESDYYRAQSNFVNELVNFAKTYNVHVHLVAHPKKKDGAINDMYDVSGTADIPGLAHNIFCLERAEDEKEYDTVLKVFKDRNGGSIGHKLGLVFDDKSKRFYQQSDPLKGNKKYGWERIDYSFGGIQGQIWEGDYEQVDGL